MNMRFATSLMLLAAAITAACDTPDRQQARAATPPAAAGSSITVPPTGLIPGTPPGDLGDWVKEIRRGLSEAADLAKRDAASAQRKALDLYVTRQEYAEMYYGVDGRTKATEELAQAIETAEARFHELMKLLGTQNPDARAVAQSIDALDAQQSVVAKLWKKSGARLDRTTLQ